MRITKYAHACLLIEIENVRIITDPGSWNPLPEAEQVDALLITHEHQDHFDIEQVKAILAKNPGMKILTHEAVGTLLTKEGIEHIVLGKNETTHIQGVSIRSIGTDHAAVYGGTSPCRNSGYLINAELYIPGDALSDVPDVPVRVLALPCGGPWLKLSEAIDYAKAVKPEAVFPIHDAMYTDEYRSGLVPRIVGGNLESAGIRFTDMAAGATNQF